VNFVGSCTPLSASRLRQPVVALTESANRADRRERGSAIGTRDIHSLLPSAEEPPVGGQMGAAERMVLRPSSTTSTRHPHVSLQPQMHLSPPFNATGRRGLIAAPVLSASVS